MATTYSVNLPKSLKETLEAVVNDKHDGLESKAKYKEWMQVDSMDDQWVEDLEMAGPGLASELAEGGELVAGSITEGVAWRYTARKFGLKVVVTDEAIEDSKYPQIIMALKRIKRSMWKTVDYDAANILARGWNSSFTFGDGVELFSTAHTLPGGGTFSNTLATPMTPSRAALIVVQSALNQLPGHDGLIEGYRMKGVVCPSDQWAVWAGIIGSAKAPEAGQFNEINVINRDFDLKVCANPYWRNTSTNWAVWTDCEHGVKFRWRRKPRSKSWMENDNELRKFGISARWSRGVSDPRYLYGSEA